jgi:hypothetical protein
MDDVQEEERVIRCTPFDVYVPRFKHLFPLHPVIHHVPWTFDYRSHNTQYNNNYPSTTENDGIHHPIGCEISSQKCSRRLQVKERARKPVVNRTPAKYRLLHLSGEHQALVWSDLVLELNHLLRDLISQSINRLQKTQKRKLRVRYIGRLGPK